MCLRAAKLLFLIIKQINYTEKFIILQLYDT